jgi:RND family efflux transporter MFP subunit
MKTRTKWIAALVGVLVLSAGISRAIVARKAQQNELSQSMASAQGGAVMLSSRDVVIASEQALQRSLAVSGSLTAQRSAIVKAKVAAELLKLTVREGDAVAAGQVIGQLDPQEFEFKLKQSQEQAASAKAQWQIAQQNLENSQALVKQGFISRNALDTAQSNASSTRANYEATKSAVELASKAVKDSLVRSPIAGLVSQRFVQVGERVGVDARIVEVVDLSSLELQAPLSPSDVLQVKVGTPASLKVEGLDQPLDAQVARINPSASADTRAVMVYLGLKDQARLRQGLFVQGRILLGLKETLAVPISAVVRDAGQDHVLVVPEASSNGQVKVRKVAVQLGSRGTTSASATADLVEVLSGLKAGDQVVAQGAGTVREGQLVMLAAKAPAAR